MLILLGTYVIAVIVFENFLDRGGIRFGAIVCIVLAKYLGHCQK